MKLLITPCSALPAILAVSVMCFARFSAGAADAARVTVRVDQPGHAVPSTLHGLFFEDINCAGDGGLYAELVQNRSFEDREPLYAWREVAPNGVQGRLAVESEAPLNANNLHFLRVYLAKPAPAGFGVANTGFDGIALREGDRYRFSIYARRRAGDTTELRVVLESGAGQSLPSIEITGPTLRHVFPANSLTVIRTMTE